MKDKTILLMIAITVCSMALAQKAEQNKMPETDTALQVDSILQELKEIKEIQINTFSMQNDIQKKRTEEIDSIRNANAGTGKSEIGIMAQIEDNTNEKFWSSGFTFVAILSIVFGFFSFWFQQKTEQHTKNASISSQLGVLKDIPRHFYRNLVCTVAMLVKYRHKDNLTNNRFRAYPSEANVMKLQSLPEEFILSIDTAKDDIYKEMHQQKLLFKNYNLEVAVASEHFSRKDMKEESLANDYDNILYKPIALIKGIQKLYSMLESYNKHLWWKENLPKQLANWMIKVGILSEKQTDKEQYLCDVITNFVATHFSKLDFDKIRDHQQVTYFNEIVQENQFKQYIEYNGKQGIERSLNDLLKLYETEVPIHFLYKEKGERGIRYCIDIPKFKAHFFNSYDKGKIGNHKLNIILSAKDTDALLEWYGIKGKVHETAAKAYFDCWRQEKCEVKELLYNMLKIDAIIELPIIGMIEHDLKST